MKNKMFFTFFMIVSLILFWTLKAFSAEEILFFEKDFAKEFTNISAKKYLKFIENAKYTIENKKMYLVKASHNRRFANLYGCDKKGQVKAYLNMKYNAKEDILNLDLKMTFDGPMPEGGADNLLYKTGDKILWDIERFSKMKLVKVLRNANLRVNPSGKAKRIKVLKPGVVLEVLKKEGKWYQVKDLYDHKLAGWVFYGSVKRQ